MVIFKGTRNLMFISVSILTNLQFNTRLNLRVLRTPSNSNILNVLRGFNLLFVKLINAFTEKFKFKHFDLVTTFAVVAFKINLNCFTWVNNVGA